jgi:DNA replication protein DnaC
MDPISRFGRLKLPPQTGPAVGPKCATCDDTGFAPVFKDGKQVAVTRCPDCLERRRGFAPGVPEDFKAASVDSYEKGDYHLTDDNRKAIEQARFFLQDVHPGLYIYGDVGSGKTLLAYAILNDLHRAGKTVRFQKVTELLKAVVQDGTGDEFHARIVNVPVLVLDDIGAQKGTDYARQTLLTIYDARTDRGHRTIWTSNLNLDELVAFMGDDRRLASRIAGNCKVVQLDGDDYRVKAARARK